MLKTIVIAILLAFMVWKAMNWSSNRASPDNDQAPVVENKGYSNENGQIVDNQGVVVIANLGYLRESDTDAAVCRTLVNPSQLPIEHYSTQSGFDACVARCVNFTTRQVCSQFPQGSKILGTQPKAFQQMLDSCQKNIESFVTRNTHCGYLNCEP